MNATRIAAALLAIGVTLGSPPSGRAVEPPSQVPASEKAGGLPGSGVPVGAALSVEVTPPRVSYLHGEVSFWRPGAEEWTPARLNTPLAPGDVLYTGPQGNVEIQIGSRAFVRAAPGTQLGLDNQEPDFVQMRVMAGEAAFDVRALAAGNAVELDTPNAAFTIERHGYYHVDVEADSTTMRAHRGGSVVVTPASGPAATVAANQQVVVAGTEAARVEMTAAARLNAWDRWNYQRTDYLLQPSTTQSAAPNVYGAETLDEHGSWRTVDAYGPVWSPASTPAGWVPYSTGRWIWDPRFGWTWLDDAPWGWAPYHHGRWVFVGAGWAWVPGPAIVRPVYAPALVVFLGAGAVAVSQPVYWAPLGWGEPVIPWWGRPGFVGVPWWGGWAGPRVVNNVVVNRTVNVNVTNISVYRNVTVTNAVVGVPGDRFGQGQVPPVRVGLAQAQQLAPVHGALALRPVAASMTLAPGQAAPRPPAAIGGRSVVATRPPSDVASALRTQGLATGPGAASPAPSRLVLAPRRAIAPAATAGPAGESGAASTPAEPTRQRHEPRQSDAAARSAPPVPGGSRGGPAPAARPPEKVETNAVTPAPSPGETAPDASKAPSMAGREKADRTSKESGGAPGRGKEARRQPPAPPPPSRHTGTARQEKQPHAQQSPSHGER